MVTRRSLLAGGVAAVAGTGVPAGPPSSEILIKNVGPYRVVDPIAECVRLILTHRGERYSPAYVQGIAGTGLRVAGPCVCGPTSSDAIWPEELLRLFGYEAQYVRLDEDGVDPDRRLDEILVRLKSSMRDGRPVLVWHAFTNAEWDVVCGFDESKHELMGRGSYRGLTGFARAHERRTLESKPICGLMGAVFVGRKRSALNARKAEAGALRSAVSYARGKSQKYPYPGLQCYQVWIDSFKAEPPKNADSGDKYCLGCYRSSQRAGAGFLAEIAPKYSASSAAFRTAASHLAAEADSLDQCAALFPWEGKGPMDGRARNDRAADLLMRARDSFAAGIESIDAGLKNSEL